MEHFKLSVPNRSFKCVIYYEQLPTSAKKRRAQMGIDSSLIDAEINDEKRNEHKKQEESAEASRELPVPRLHNLERLPNEEIIVKKKRASSYQQRLIEIEERKINEAENARATMEYLKGQSRMVKSARRLEECAYFRPVEKPEVDKGFKFSDGSPLNWKWSQDYGKSSEVMETIKEEPDSEQEFIEPQAGFALFIPARESQMPSIDQLVTHRE